VPAGGNYDGDVGVIGALECIELLNSAAIVTRHPLEVVVFSDEEGSLVGSRTMAGEAAASVLDVVGHDGRPLREGLRAIGGDPDRLLSARRRPDELRAFLELHVEQGGLLEAKGLDVGVVEGIVGIDWWDVVVEGTANHAGTTPMDQRQDALVDATALPALTDARIRRAIAQAADELHLKSVSIPSGAGHDAQDMAHLTPTGMIFVPSRGGISHSPKEFTSPEQMARGVDVLLRAILAVDAGALD
jgi:acetylornithine deacetylase/succinyl-diaminopimelate desuccinylase-like protein